MIRLYLWIIIMFSFASGQITSQAIVDSVKTRYDLIQDYSVQVKLAVEMPGFRMPRKRIKLFFKQPDKLKIESDGFALVPRQGLGVAAILDSLTAIEIIGEETIFGYPCWILRGRGREGELQFETSAWVDQQDWVIRQIKSMIDTTQVAQIELEYSLIDRRYLLPIKTTVMIDLPQLMATRMDHYDPDGSPFPQAKSSEKGNRSGKVTLEFNRYRVNRGLKDSFFRE
ncbi:MAG: hypothetical protein HQ528_11555 [Candidatus Marinimicrobia bacterium]|nr:hypothetical protein [Candidatus Neomarinimicrobiota bacterium]